MDNHIECKLTPSFVKPIKRKKAQWKTEMAPIEFYNQLQNEKSAAIVNNIRLPIAVIKTLKRLDKLNKKNNVLLIDNILDIAHLFCIVTHKNAHLIKKIDFSFDIISFEDFRIKHLKKIKAFEEMYSVTPPDDLIELAYLHKVFRYVFTDLEPSWWLHGFDEISGIFKSIFSPRLNIHKKDILSLRHGHHDLSYFPVFDWGGDGVSHGYVFDLQLNSFTCCAWHGDGDYGLAKSLWDSLSRYITFDVDSSEWALDELQKRSQRENPRSNYLKFNELLWDTCELKKPLFTWLINLLISNYCQRNIFKGCYFDKVNKERYGDYYYKVNYDLSKNKKYYAARTYPKIVLSIKEHFHPLFTHEQLERLFSMFGLFGTSENLLGFLYEDYPITEIIINKKYKKHVTTKFWKFFYKSVINFAEKECDEKRYGLALILGNLIWTETNNKTSPYAVKLLSKIPDEFCHPLIKKLAYEHGKTRFDDSIHT